MSVPCGRLRNAMRRSPQNVSTASTMVSSSSSALRPPRRPMPNSQMATRQGLSRCTPCSSTSAVSSSGAPAPESRSRSSRRRRRRVATISSRRLSRSSEMSRCKKLSAMSANTELAVREACATMSRSTLPYSSTSRHR